MDLQRLHPGLYSRGRLRINGGLRYDWQTSKYLGGCVPANQLVPDLLPAQCEDATDGRSDDRPQDPVVRQLVAARSSVIYDLLGNGKTAGARQLLVLLRHEDHAGQRARRPLHQPALTWGTNQSSGACSATAGASCWNDANRDGRPGQRADRHADLEQLALQHVTGMFKPAGNTVDPSAQIGRTREVIIGVQHELITNMAVGVDYIYRKYDRGTANYTHRLPAGRPAFRCRDLHRAADYTDPVTGYHRAYYVVCQGCSGRRGSARSR